MTAERDTPGAAPATDTRADESGGPIAPPPERRGLGGRLGRLRPGGGPRRLVSRWWARPDRGVTILRRLVAGAGVGLVVLYAALLRFDAVTLKYGPVATPGWLGALQQSRGPESALRPAGVSWTPVGTFPHRDGSETRYRSDPYTYLQYARDMRSFYAAHRREPLFPFVTRGFLWLLGQQDVAVSFASASFSVLVVVATFLLGAYAFSYWVGLGAALAVAVEYHIVSLGAEGWRDDAFTLGVVLSAYALLRCHRAPTIPNAVVAGLVAGLSCLVRITSLSFLLPAFLWLLLARRHPWRPRATTVGVGLLVMGLLVGPFMVNCWRVFGDPLYAINVHADVYREAEGEVPERGQTAAEYLGGRAVERPIRTLETSVLGMTSYPFTNKWRGFEPWIPGLGPWLSWAAIGGLILMLGSPAGRFLLVVLAGSLLPYALTWRVIADWRFTMHAYPFFLLAAMLAIDRLVAAIMPQGRRALRQLPVRRLAAWAAVLAGVTGGVWVVRQELPVLAARESLAAGEAVTITAGARDRPFFAAGWSAPESEGAVTFRLARGAFSVVRLPLPARRDCSITLRLDPFPRPSTREVNDLPVVRVFLNDRPLARLQLYWDPERVGAYEVLVPGGIASRWLNRLAFVIEPPPGAFRTFRLWYVRVRPSAS